MKSEIKVYADGGSRGNPGPSASAFLVEKKGEVIYSESKYLGNSTNNRAEYMAIIMALKWLTKNRELIGDGLITFFLDTELAVRQLTGVYKIKNAVLKKLVRTAK